MKTRVKMFAILCTITLLPALFAAHAAAQPAAGQAVPRAAAVIDNPIIQSFNVNPGTVVQGDPVALNWIVSAGPGGSAITQVSVTVDGNTLISNASTTFSFSRPFGWGGEKTFVLTARNAAGKISTQSKSVRGVTLAEVMSKVTIYNLEANPQRFSPGQPIDFTVVISNANSGLPLRPANIFVTQGSRVVGNRTNINLNPGSQTFVLQDSGFTAVGGVYTVDVEFKGQHKTRTFMTKPVTMYTIDPASP